jgi:hypothetical protein
MSTTPELAEQLLKVCLHELSPKVKQSAGRPKVSSKALSSNVDIRMARILAAAKNIRSTNKLGIFKLAKIVFNVQRGLLEAGHPPAFVKKMIFAILTNALVGK